MNEVTEQALDIVRPAQLKSCVTDLMKKAENALPEGVSFDHFYVVEYGKTLKTLRLQGEYDSKIVMSLATKTKLVIDEAGFTKGSFMVDDVTINIVLS